MTTVERPFTERDLVRHSMWTWAPAMVVVVVMMLSSAAAAVFSITIVIGIIVLLLVWLAAPFALALGYALRRVRPIAIHLLAFAALGYVVTNLLVVVATAIWVAGAANLGSPQVIALSLGCAGCVVIGRSAAFLLRRRDDRRAAAAGPSDSFDSVPNEGCARGSG